MTHDPLNLLQTAAPQPQAPRHPGVRARDDAGPRAPDSPAVRARRRGRRADRVDAGVRPPAAQGACWPRWRRARAVGVDIIALFPAVAEALKTLDAAARRGTRTGSSPNTIKALKDRWPDLVIVTDVALDPYNSDGHDGIVAPDGRILNDETVEALCNQALCAGARRGRHRRAVGHDGRPRAGARARRSTARVSSMCRSSRTRRSTPRRFYGPFRDALDSAPKSGDKKTYQMDPANAREALRESRARRGRGRRHPDGQAGRALPRHPRGAAKGDQPAAARPYQVSGEYAMLKAAQRARLARREAGGARGACSASAAPAPT